MLTDFDGSLAAIVDDPAAAVAAPGATDALAALAAVMGVVAVVSGRPVSFLQRAVPVEGVALAGLYGMERLIEGEVVIDPAARPYLGLAEQAALEVEGALPGLHVERKSSLSCVIHWRQTPDREADALEVGRRVAAAHGLAAELGRRSLELRPPVPLDKGTAAASLVGGMDAALFAGDDRGDLAAFDALDDLVRAGGLGWAVKVAVASDEAPAELLDRADERVSGPDELVAVFAALADSASAAS